MSTYPDISLLTESLNKIGIAAYKEQTPMHTLAVTCYYKNNPDGSVRWIWPAKNRHADHLRFYHIAGWKLMLLAILTRILAKAGLSRLIADGKCSFFTAPVIGQCMKEDWGFRWAWFSGTVGPNRKTIFWHWDVPEQTGSFIKIPLTAQAKENLVTEAEQLRILHSGKLNNISIPAPAPIGNGCLLLLDVSNNSNRTNRFSELPFRFVKEWLFMDAQYTPYTGSTFERNLHIMITLSAARKDQRVPAEITEKLQSLYKNNTINGQWITTTAHGDFTPWNVMKGKHTLRIIDWELSRSQMPILFDLFHFVYQSNILIGNKGYKAIRKELDNLFALPYWKQLLEEYHIDTNTAERCYLLYTMAYYLDVYSRQDKWHTQVNWLINTWNEALTWHLNAVSATPVRKLVLKDLGLQLNKSRYALLKWRYTNIDTLPTGSDVDICINKEDAHSVISHLKQQLLVAGIRIRRKSFMTQVELLLRDGSLLHLDMIHVFRRKNIVYMSAEKLLANATRNTNNVCVPAPEDDFTYTWLFYCLNKAAVPEHYKAIFEKAPQADKERFTRQVHTYGLYTDAYTEVLDASIINKRRVEATCIQQPENSGFKALTNKAAYLKDLLKELRFNKGFIITFSGVDGAGKSTIINNVKEQLDKQLRRRVIVLRHRPSILPVLSAITHGKQKAEQVAAQTLPRQGKNNNLLSSLLRFSYYYIDYLVGQWYVEWMYVRRGYIVLYDRYYFDFINDARRSNIQLPAAFTRWCYHFLVKPRLNFFLYADTQVILQRKQELEANVINKLTNRYLSLFETLKRKSNNAWYIPIENDRLPDTLNTIFCYIKSVNYENIH